MKKGVWRLFVVLWFSAAACFSATADRVYVDAAALGSNDGSSWADAYTDLRQALNSGATEVWVAQGTYHPDIPNGDRSRSFVIHSGQQVYGGFRAGATSLAERDPGAYPTVLSGDLNENDTPTGGNMSENAYHVVFADGAPDFILDGFTIRSGNAYVAQYGAGAWFNNSSGVIRGCTIEKNVASVAAGILMSNAAVQVNSCVFRNNSAWSGSGGGLYVQNDGTPVSVEIASSLFEDNTALVNGAPGDGGAMYLSGQATVNIHHCVFQRNKADWRFTDDRYPAGGGAIVHLTARALIWNCLFKDNTAMIGGALWCARDATLVNCVFMQNTAIERSGTYGDFGGLGGAIYAFVTAPMLINCTIYRNTAKTGGGIVAQQSSVGLRNSILWHNTSQAEGATLREQQIVGSATFRYSLVEGLLTPSPGQDPPDPSNFPGCLDTDPLFVDADGVPPDNVRLTAQSPAVDAGENAVYPETLPSLDADEKPRFIEAPSAPNTGLGTAPLIDMGAYEMQDTSVEGAVEGTPNEGSVEGVPQEGAVEGIPVEGGTEGIPKEGANEGVPVEGTAEGIPQEGNTEGVGVEHSADQNGDRSINLSELLRVIQFYNSDGYHCSVGSEDGYGSGPGDTSCAPHASDYNPQNWRIELSELLRLIQFFNAGGYHPCAEGEDGFCPGP